MISIVLLGRPFSARGRRSCKSIRFASASSRRRNGDSFRFSSVLCNSVFLGHGPYLITAELAIFFWARFEFARPNWLTLSARLSQFVTAVMGPSPLWATRPPSQLPPPFGEDLRPMHTQPKPRSFCCLGGMFEPVHPFRRLEVRPAEPLTLGNTRPTKKH